jgi:hypothetical protein
MPAISQASVISVLKGVRCSIRLWQRGQRRSAPRDARDTARPQVRQGLKPSSSDCFNGRHVLTAGAIDHQDAGSQRPSSASTVVKAAIAQMPAPAVMGTQFASFTIATKAPSKKTSVMLQGRIRCKQPHDRSKAGRPVPDAREQQHPEEERYLHRRDEKGRERKPQGGD